jgi:hypothetical protein
MLPDPADAADAVRGTFLIATSRLERLRDPDKLGSWLDAVARNECLRRRSAAGVKPGPSSAFSPGVSSPAAAVDGDGDPAELPAELRGQVLAACADSSPSGRADRASAAHRAGTFSAAGFPRPFGSSGPRWWRPVRRHRRTAAAAAALVAVAAAAGLVTILTVGGSHRAHAATLALGGSVPGGSSVPASASPPGSPTPSQRGSSPAHPTPSATAIGDVATPGLPPGQVTPSAPASSSSASPSASASPSPSPSPSPSSSPSPTSLPTEGSLSVSPDKLVLTATSGKAVTGTFLLSAFGGPVRNYTITVPSSMAGKVTVSPAMGSLSASGWVTVTVTVTSKVALNTQITVNPGAITVTVVLSIKA